MSRLSPMEIQAKNSTATGIYNNMSERDREKL